MNSTKTLPNSVSRSKSNIIKRKRTKEDAVYDPDGVPLKTRTTYLPPKQIETGSQPPSTLNSNHFLPPNNDNDYSTAPSPSASFPPLHEVPKAVSVLFEMIQKNISCPQCGSAVHCRRYPRFHNECYTCDACHKVFDVPPATAKTIAGTTTCTNTSSSHSLDIHDKQESTQYQSKLHLKHLINYAQSEILKEDMKEDQLHFQARVKKLIARIDEKRNRIVDCLGVTFGDHRKEEEDENDDDDDNNEEEKEVNNNNQQSDCKKRSPSKIGQREEVVGGRNSPIHNIHKSNENVCLNGTTCETTIDKAEMTNPLQQSIQLLKNEIHVMEHVVGNLLRFNRGTKGSRRWNKHITLPSSLSLIQNVDDWNEVHDDINILTGPCRATVESVSPPSEEPSMNYVDNKARYILASRVLQEDGEEIEIYEKNLVA